MGISGAQRATLYDEVTDDFVEIELISQDSSYSKDDLFEEDLDGNEIVLEQRARLVLAYFDEADLVQLKSWASNHTKVKAVVMGLQDYIFWDRESTIRLSENYNFQPRRRNVRQVFLNARGVDLDVDKTTPIQLIDENGYLLIGFRGTDEDDEGITAHTIPPAYFGATGDVSWSIGNMIYNMETVEFNTLD